MTRTCRPLAWVALGGLTLVLHRLGRGPLGPPPLFSGHETAAWWQQRGPLLGTFAAAREVLWWIGCYLVAMGMLATLVRERQAAGLVRRLSRCHLPGARTMFRVSLGASALGALLLARAGSSSAAGGGVLGPPEVAAPPPTGNASRTGEMPNTDTATTASVLPSAGDGSGTPGGPSAAAPVLRYAGRAAGKPGVTPAPLRHRQPGRVAKASNGEVSGGRTWTVRPGDSLWSIAESTLSAARGHAPDARELGHYWWQIVETNRPRLPIPSNPDLLFAGDEVLVPPPPVQPMPAPDTGG